MGYQFVHIAGYARKGSQQRKNGKMQPRKWSIRDIVAEAMREPDSCPHVWDPQPPKLLHGAMPSQLEALAEAYAATVQDAQGRKLRADGLCVAAGVVSLPADRADDWPQYRAAAVDFLREQYGKRLRSVVEHIDEEHPHLHFYAVPFDGERFEVLHVGRQAAAQAAQEGKAKGAQNAAYKAAMQAWQDDFHAKVSASFGLARTGPKRERLSRAEWQARKARLRADAKACQAVGPVITPDQVKKRVTKAGFFKEYETGQELAKRLDVLAREKYAPVTRAAALVASSQNRADAMQRLADDRGQEAESLRVRLAAAEAKAEAAQKDVALYQQIFMDGLDGPEQAVVMDRAQSLRREKAAKAKAQQEASWSPEYRAHQKLIEAEFQRSLREIEAEEQRKDDDDHELEGPGAE